MSNYSPPGDFPDVALLIILGGVGWVLSFYISKYAKRKHQETYLRNQWKKAARRVVRSKKGGIVRQSVSYITTKLKSSRVGHDSRRQTIVDISKQIRKNMKLVENSKTAESDTNSSTELDPEEVLRQRTKKIEGMFEYVMKRNSL